VWLCEVMNWRINLPRRFDSINKSIQFNH
jgi:hypothetical protein